LLGTVTGMIHTFQTITLTGSGDPRFVSGGIAEALVTTESGLVIAIPVVLMHAYLARRVRTIVAGLEQTTVAFVNGLKRLDPT
jgi:biopolymer transport protein ExbB